MGFCYFLDNLLKKIMQTTQLIMMVVYAVSVAVGSDFNHMAREQRIT